MHKIKRCCSILTIGCVHSNMYLFLSTGHSAQTRLKLYNAKIYFTPTTQFVSTDVFSSDTLFCKYVELSMMLCLLGYLHVYINRYILFDKVL